MNNNETTVKTEISSEIETTTINIPMLITLSSTDTFSKDMIGAEINLIGQIVITPIDDNVSISTAEVINKNDSEETRVENLTVDGTMLVENNTNSSVDVYVDESGRCIISPVAENNSFISVAVEDSLNLITEEIKRQEYLGFTLCNNGDGWDITDVNGEIIDTGVATLEEAKIVILKQELSRLQGDLNEDTKEETDNEVPEVEATLVESVDAINVEKELSELTNNYEDIDGVIECDSREELEVCKNILSKYYTTECSENELSIKYNRNEE